VNRPDSAAAPALAREDGRVALVTGAGNGIGRAIARALAARGNRVALNDVDLAVAAQAASLLTSEEEASAHVVPFGGDVADASAMRGLVAEVVERFGRLDVAVVNAALVHQGPFLDDEPDLVDRLLAVNVRGAFFTAQAAARAMVSCGHGGRIVFVSSVSGIQPVDGMAAYGMTKAALLHLARCLATELGPLGITVNAVAPGVTVTEKLVRESGDYYHDAWAALTPTGRAAGVEEVAAAAVFLCAPESGHVNGQTLVVDGGWTLNSPSPAPPPLG
jgi:3-oxoacyl-[acyl-carrier protein] reductase